MKKRRMALLALLLVLAMLVCGCSGKQESKEETKEDAVTTESKTEPQVKTVTSENKDEIKAMVAEFYQGLEEEDPICLTTYSSGEEVSVFVRAGDQMSMYDKASEMTYYMFELDGQHYVISDGENALKDDFMYQMYESSLELTMMLYINGVFENEDDEGFIYSAVKTEVGDAVTELSYEINGTVEEKPVKVSVAGKKGADGKVSEINYAAESDGEKNEYRFTFTYDGVSVDLPEYTIVKDASDIEWKYEMVESPYATVKDLKDAFPEDLSSMLYDTSYYAYASKDGHYYQFRAELSPEDMENYNALDIMDDDYEEKAAAILDPLAIADCMDFTESAPAQSEVEAYVGKKVSDLAAKGFEVSGYSFWEEGAKLFFSKDGFEYEADVTVTEGFDAEAEHEYDEFNDFTVDSLVVTGPAYSVLPILVQQ
ncbi:MAG: hypothetical protein II930_04550 [Lachnospiraceae bacterium]|nr:hypothetical protein [Lachnospiraceae bacterium]